MLATLPRWTRLGLVSSDVHSCTDAWYIVATRRWTSTELKGNSMTRAGSMPVGTNAPGRAAIQERTLRTDNWRKSPAIVFLLLSGWVLYALIRTVWQAAYFAPQE